MDAQWSMGLAWTYFTYPDYLVVQCLAHTTYLSSDTINQTGSQSYQYVKFLKGWLGYMPLGAPCN